jgi:hypothetical protein
MPRSRKGIGCRGAGIAPRRTGRPARYPWRTMRVGQWFEMPLNVYAHDSIKKARKRTGRCFSARKTESCWIVSRKEDSCDS